MTPIEALHTAARRYCRDRAMLWRERYGAMLPAPASETLEAVFIRYLVLDAILEDVESMAPEEFQSLEGAQEWLLLAGETAESLFTRSKEERADVVQQAILEERALFCGFARGYAEARQGEPVPLPFRRKFTLPEGRKLWARVDARWGTASGDCWYPLTRETPEHAVAFRADWFRKRFGVERLRGLLKDRGVTRVFELSELRSAEYEIDVELVDAIYGGDESYWMPHDLAWLIYASHENSLTIAGESMVEAIKTAWPDWERSLWCEDTYLD